jgi:LCP family protein required for cell wall assembly
MKFLMDNFRRYRPQHNHSSTDGFIRSGTPRKVGQVPNLKRGNAYQSVRPRVGNFRSTDGFHPAARSMHVGAKPEHVSAFGRQPARDTSGKIQLDRPQSTPVKRRRFRRIRAFLSLFFFNPFNWRNWTKKRVAASFVSMVLLAGGFFGARTWWLAGQIFQGGGGAVALQDNVDPALLRGEGDGRVNILLLGRGGPGHEGADLTDTIVIASINPIQKEAALLSVPRDLYVQTGTGGYSKINAVFANAKNNALANFSSSDKNRVGKAEDAGFKAIEDVIKSKIGIPIHYHGIIDFSGFAKAINTVGGIDVDVPKTGVVYENMRILGQNYTLNVKQGRSHFTGLRALAYSRSRYTSARGDFDRSERQRLILVALKDKVFSAGTYGNPLKISQLMSDFGNHIRTNLSLDEVKRLYEIGNQIPSNKIASVGLADPPNNYVTTGMIYGQSVVYPRAGLDNYKEIQHFVRNRLKDGFLADENATVAIYNGTNIAGLATRTSDDLKSYGYNISKVGDSPTKGVQKTIVVDLRNGTKKYTKRYLENRFSTTATASVPANSQINPGMADFVIILGQNEQTRLAN